MGRCGAFSVGYGSDSTMLRFAGKWRPGHIYIYILMKEWCSAVPFLFCSAGGIRVGINTYCKGMCRINKGVL